MSLLLVVRYPEEGPGLLSWARPLAAGIEVALEVVVCDPAAGAEIEWAEEGAERPDYFEGGEERWGKVALRSALSAVHRHVKESSVKYVLIGKHNSGKGAKDSPERRFSRAVFQLIPCAVIVLRLPADKLIRGRILVPCSGGPHSRVALRLARRMGETTAFFVEPDVDEVSREVGERQLAKVLRRAGVEDDVVGKVALGSEVFDEIRRETETGEYELMLVGASDARTLRAKLFGTVPDRLLRGPGGLAIGVVRAALPTGQRMKDALGRLLRLSVPQLKREERVALMDEVAEKARWTFDFAVLMVLATSIAGLGLLADSVAVVIGAMLVAPLMTPLIGGGLALVQGNWPLWRRSARAVLLGFFSALLIGVALGLAARGMGFGLTSELEARGEPTLLDLGVAFASGVAAAYCVARPRLTGALAGVAIAAALVPPIATVGICLSLGEGAPARGAGLLFGTNVVAIVLGAATSFFAAGIRGHRERGGLWSRRLVIGLALVCGGLAIPLTSILVGNVTEPRILERSLGKVAEDGGYRLMKLRKTRDGSGRLIDLELAGPEAPGRDLVKDLKQTAESVTRRGVKLRVRTLLETHSE